MDTHRSRALLAAGLALALFACGDPPLGSTDAAVDAPAIDVSVDLGDTLVADTPDTTDVLSDDGPDVVAETTQDGDAVGADATQDGGAADAADVADVADVEGDGGPAGPPYSYSTPIPTYDEHAADRETCVYGPGSLTTETIGPNVLHGDAMPFEHVVMLMFENRSFDHFYGALNKPEYYGPGRVDVMGCDQARGHDIDGEHDCVDPDTGLVDTTPDQNPDNWLSPPALQPTFHESRYCTVDTAHDWNHVHTQWNGGAMDGFVASNNIYGPGGGGGRTMGYYDDSDIPFWYWLSNTFAISDRHFCSLLGPTWPNRFYFTSATSRGRTATPDTPIAASHPNLMNRMEDAGRSVKIYRDGIVSFLVGGYLAPKYLGSSMWSGGSSFDKAVADDTLADLVFLDPSFTGANQNDDHPPANIQNGQALVAKVVKTLMSNPAVWAKTVLLITYDEHGGYYDHVNPPAACEPDGFLPGTGGNDKFDRLGMRVPLLVVSPFAKAHYVSHLTTDLTSLTRFVENRFDLPALTARDANAWPLLDMFDFDDPPFMDPLTVPMELAAHDPVKVQWCEDNAPGTGVPPEAGGDPTPIPVPVSCSGGVTDIEPNGSGILATPLPPLGDCDIFVSDKKIFGNLAGAGDIDYFYYEGEDQLFCVANPKVELQAGPNMEACLFVSCAKGPTTLVDGDDDGDNCDGGYEKWIDSGTTKGCCVTAVGATARVEFDCTTLGGLDDSADVYMRVRSTLKPADEGEAVDAGQCMPYEIHYHF